MFNNWKISARQFKYIVILCFIGTSIVLHPAYLAIEAKQDAWLAVLLGIVIGMLLVWLYTTLGSLYPDMNIIQITKKILGKKLGTFISLLFVLYLILDCSAILWISGNFITTEILVETPIQYTNILLMIIVVIATRLGLETFARAGELLLPIVFGLTIILIVFVTPNIEDFNNIKPIYEFGMKPIFRGAIYFVSFTVLTNFVLMMIFPANVINFKEAKKSYFSGTIFSGIIIFIVTFICILVLGANLSSRETYPTYILAKKIHLGNFVQRIEIIIAIIWIITVFYKTVIFFYSIVLGFAQTFELKDYRPLTFPIAMILIVSTLVMYPNSIYFDEWDASTFLPFILMPCFFMPILLLIVGLIQKKLKSKNTNA